MTKILQTNRVLGVILLLGIVLLSHDHATIRQYEYNSGSEQKKTKTATIKSLSEMKHSSDPNPTINVFYNLYIKDEGQVERVKSIVSEQLSYLLPEEHKEVQITSLGFPQNDIPNAKVVQKFPEGDEDETLHLLWQYCKSNPYHDTKVVYLHSKGSFHNTPENEKLRNFVTRSALSKECANLPDKCNVCSSRMSPLPHAHTSGNMWLARCDHVAKLPDPKFERVGKFEELKSWGRYFNEHWIHMHPSMQACDLYPGREFSWGMLNIPEGDFQIDLQMAPRFDFDAYIAPFTRPEIEKPKETFVNNLMKEFSLFYDLQPGVSWWGWNFFETTLIEFMKDHKESFQ